MRDRHAKQRYKFAFFIINCYNYIMINITILFLYLSFKEIINRFLFPCFYFSIRSMGYEIEPQLKVYKYCGTGTLRIEGCRIRERSRQIGIRLEGI